MSNSLSFIIPSFFLSAISLWIIWWRAAEQERKKSKKKKKNAPKPQYQSAIFLSVIMIFGAYAIWYGLSFLPQKSPQLSLSYPLVKDVNGFTNRRILLEQQQQQQRQVTSQKGAGGADTMALAQGLEDKLRAGTAAKEQWFLLAKTYEMTGDNNKVAFAAIEGYKAHKDMPESAQKYQSLLRKMLDSGYDGSYAAQARQIIAE